MVGSGRFPGPCWTRFCASLERDAYLAVLAGWLVTETGRAPWLVYGLMTHAQGVTPSLTGGMALFTLLGYITVYAMIFSAGLYYLMRVLQDGLEVDALHGEEDDDVHRPSRPLSGSDVTLEH